MAIEWLVAGVLGLLGLAFGAVLNAAGAAINALGGGGLGGGIVVGYSWLNTFLPVNETAAAISSLLTLYAFLFGYRFLREHWSLVPFVGGHS